MNIISCFVFAAAIGSLIAGKKIGNKAILFGGLCGLIPAADWLVSLLFNVPISENIRGGVTHSFVFCLLFAPVLGWALHKYVDRTCSFLRWANLALWCMVSHCLYDSLTIDGVAFLEPFSHHRFALSVLSNVDVIGLIPLAVAFVGALILKDWHHKVMISWFGGFLFVLYVSFTFLNKLSVHSQFEQSLDEKDIRYSRVDVYPVSGSLFLWNCIAQDRDGFWMGYRSNLSKNDFDINLVLRNDYYLFELEDNQKIKQIEAYTRYYYGVEPKSSHSVLLHDLRYGKDGLKSDAPFARTYEIDFSSELVIERK